MNPFLRVIEALNKHDVRYVIVGGFAAVMHGNDRFTKNLDIVIDLRPDEARRAIAALTSVGMVCRVPVDPFLFADGAERERWKRDKGAMVFTMIDPATPVFAVDLFLDYPMDFEQMLSRARQFDVKGLTFSVCSLDDLIEMKQRSGRPQDLLDIETLRKLQ